MLNKIEYNATLVDKYLRNELTEKEQKELEEWINSSEDNKKKFEELTDTSQLVQKLEALDRAESRKHEAWQKTERQINRQARLVSLHWWKFPVAAAILVLVAIVGIMFLNRKGNMPASKTDTKQMPAINDAAPGQFKAKLTLADGSTIILDSAKSGALVQQGGTTVLNKDGKLIYEKGGETNKVLYNRLSTSKAQTYATVLSDGTKVWLNSESSIRYPVAFTGEERKVEITGEAYFEVAPSVAVLSNGQKVKRTFIVSLNGMEVEVLGTHFNINSYADEPAIKTTLLEGKVRVHSATDNAQTILMPGEQAVVRRGQNEKIVINKDVDVDAAVAWRFGMFQFNNDDLQIVLRQISRWYDVDVVYLGQIPKETFWGKILRNNSLSQVLETLHSSDVHFKIEGKKIIVSQ